MSLSQASAVLKSNVQGHLGEYFSLLTNDMDRVRSEGTVKNALTVGQSAPHFTLPDAFGNQVSLQSLLAQGPVIISFYRGEWCPFCNLELHAFEELLPKIKQLGATLVAISPEKPDHGIVITEKNKLTFPVLSDFGNKQADLPRPERLRQQGRAPVRHRLPGRPGAAGVLEERLQERSRRPQRRELLRAAGPGHLRPGRHRRHPLRARRGGLHDRPRRTRRRSRRARDHRPPGSCVASTSPGTPLRTTPSS
jgi:peroxiredoxin